MTGPTVPEREWPEWFEPLRPDDVARARMRASIRERTERELARRRRRAVWEASDALARRLTPLAAAAALLFGWLALNASPEPDPRPVAVEEMLRPAAGEGPPAFLVSVQGPATEHAFEATFGGSEDR